MIRFKPTLKRSLYYLFKVLKFIPAKLIARGKRAEQMKAGKKWDSIVEELKRRK